MIKSRWLVIIPGAVLMLCFGSVGVTTSPALAAEASVPIYCHGPLSTYRTDGGKFIRTPFKWAKEAASKANPGPGECAFADRTPQPTEGKPGDENAIMGPLGPYDTMPVGTFGKICVVWADAGPNKNLIVREVIRGEDARLSPFHSPPFSAGTAGCPG
jgi:hypothetical protein